MQFLATLYQQHFHSKQQLLHLALTVALAVAVGTLPGQPVVEQRDLKVKNVEQPVFLLDDKILILGQLIGNVQCILQLDAFVADPREKIVQLPEIADVGGLLEQQGGRALFDLWLKKR